jgi:hypothetical protein
LATWMATQFRTNTAAVPTSYACWPTLPPRCSTTGGRSPTNSLPTLAGRPALDNSLLMEPASPPVARSEFASTSKVTMGVGRWPRTAA